MRKLSILCLILSALLSACGAPQQPAAETPADPAGVHPTVAWIMACRAENGGFGCFPGDSAFVSRTGMAIDALYQLGELRGMPDPEKTISYLLGMQRDDGGFIERENYYYDGKLLPWGTMSALEPTYWAVRTLKYFGKNPSSVTMAANFIKARQQPSGAFDASEIGWGGAKEAVYSTYWAVATLKELGEPIPDSARVVEWLKVQQDTHENRGGFRLSVDNFNYASSPGTYYAVQALMLLGAAQERPAEVKRFLLSSYGQEADGGFEIGHGDNWNNFDHYSLTECTWMAVTTLRTLGMPLTDQDSSRAARPRSDCIAWLGAVQNADGGFGRVGVTEQTPVASPSEMRATWQAVSALGKLEAEVPRPENPVEPKNEVQAHMPLHRHPTIHNEDPVDVWAYRRIALPVYEHALAETGSRVAAVGALSRWARAVVGPENASYLTGGRGVLHGGWGQCGQMSQLLQQLASSVDHAARYSFVIGDVNCEVLIQEDGWDAPHWCLFIPFTNEYTDPSLATPTGERDGWSLLDHIVDTQRRRRNLNYPSRTLLGDHLLLDDRVETIDFQQGKWGREVKIDSLTTYDSPEAAELYPGGSW
jgi:prenyltransferase beta subunit